MRRALHGTNWDLAQKLPVTVRGEFWLIPGYGVLCLLAHIGGLTAQSCAPTQVAIANGAAVVTLNAHPRRSFEGRNRFMIGVGPDRAHEVLVHTGDSVTVRPVNENGVFTLHDSATNPPDVLTFR
jgi:hypothetical protein